MGLRAQVLLLGLLTLLAPALGWQGIRELHRALQQGRIEAQTLRAESLRHALADSAALASRLALDDRPPGAETAPDWYAETARWPLFVDGYADDWQPLVGEPLRFGDAAKRSLTLHVAQLGARPYPALRDSQAPTAQRFARLEPRLFLFVRVRDDDVVHHRPPRLDAEAGENERPDRRSLLVNGDALEIVVERPGGERTHALLRVIAPGPVRVVRADVVPPAPVPGRQADARGGETDGLDGQALPGWRAEWVDDVDGYQVEIELPLPEVGSRVDIAAIDVARPGGPRGRWSGSADPQALRDGAAGGGRLFYADGTLGNRLRQWVTPGTRARLFDTRGRLLAEADALHRGTRAASEETRGGAAGLLDALLMRLFAWFAAGDLPLFPETEKRSRPLHLAPERLARASATEPTRRYVTVDNDRVLGTLVDVPAGGRTGYLLFESNEEHAAAFTDRRLARLFASLLLASLAVAALSFAWATRLSFRVRRLAREAARAIDAEGRLGSPDELPRLVESGARDEIGALSRDLGALLSRSAAYTRYLEALSSRLSHELGTPLSIVRSSLENVERDRLDPESRTLVERAEGGAARLAQIVRALVASARLEQSVRQARFAPLELAAWIREAREQYAQIHRGRTFRLAGSLEGSEIPAERLPPLRVVAAAGLLQQALDKLVDNAVDFATGDDIVLLLMRERAAPSHAGERVVIGVVNDGEPLGENRRRRMFEPGFSVRPDGRATAAAHAGLGLHLVTLIAEAHGGSAFALERRTREGGDRVVVGLRLPLVRDPAASRGDPSPRGTPLSASPRART